MTFYIFISDGMKRSLAAVQGSNGKLNVAYNKVATVMTSREITVGGNTKTIQVPNAGQTDLCFSDFSLDGDLAMQANSLTTSPQKFSAGDKLDITAVVSNRGLKPAINIDVDFYYGNPSTDGVIIGSRQIIADPLAPGEDVSVSVIGWNVPSSPENRDIYVVVDPTLSYQDKDRTNNTTHLSIFKPDLAIEQVSAQKIGPVRRAITAHVTNIGTVPAVSIPVAIYQTNASGALLYQETIDALAVNESRSVVYEWDVTGIAADINDNVTAYAVVNKDKTIAETDYLNNSLYLQLPRADMNVAIDQEATPTQGVVGSQITITGANFGAIQGNGYVDFNGTRGTIITWSNTSIAVIVPIEAQSGCLKVFTELASSECHNFTVISAYNLTVSKTGSGAGIIISNPEGIACGATCVYSFAGGTSVTLTSTAAVGSTFVGWSGACNNAGTCLLTMDAQKAVTATFALNPVIPTPPATGSIGSNITIDGNNFGATQGAGYVDFNGVRGVIVSWSNNRIVATVPAGATSGCLKVVTDAGGISDCIDFTVGGGTLYADFTNYGLYQYNGSVWLPINSVNPDNMTASGGTLYADFANYGLYKYVGTTWTEINKVRPTNMLSSEGKLYATFANYGFYKYEGSAWSPINSVNPDVMTASGGILYADFQNYGLYKYEGGIWSPINSVRPSQMLSFDGKLYATFTGYGFYKYESNAWGLINSVNSDKMTASGGVLYADFANYGLYKYAGGAWSQINTVRPTNMLSSGGKLYATFTGYGFYQYDNATGWKLINSVNPESMTVSGGILYPVFKDYGFYKYDGATWTQINSVIPNKVVAGE